MTEKELKTIRFEEIFRRASARRARSKASWAKFQTGDGGRTKTIISVDHDEAIAIEWALDLYLEKTEELLSEAKLNDKPSEKM
jgi:hypothetical protein